jgi:glycosyltransferase involved in cell wall biosynthesis
VECRLKKLFDLKDILVTYTYPNAIPYIDDFIQSVNNQVYKNFKVVIFNDGVVDVETYFGALQNDFTVINLSASNVGAVRAKSMEYLAAQSSINKIVFQDIDDKLSDNRIQVALDALDSFQLVCNDLSTFDDFGTTPSIWEKRLGNTFDFDLQFIADKNIVGLGNTAVHSSLIRQHFKHSDLVIAYDWFLFYQWMKQANCTGVFTAQCQTLYRQHQNNIAGAGNMVSNEKLLHVFNVKNRHYGELIRLGFHELHTEMTALQNKKEQVINTSFIQTTTSPFWWEETELL